MCALKICDLSKVIWGIKMPKMEIEFSKEVRKVLVENLIRFYSEERDEEITHLGAELILDYIVNNIGPYIYNKAIEDAATYMSQRIEDLHDLDKRER